MRAGVPHPVGPHAALQGGAALGPGYGRRRGAAAPLLPPLWGHHEHHRAHGAVRPPGMHSGNACNPLWRWVWETVPAARLSTQVFTQYTMARVLHRTQAARRPPVATLDSVIDLSRPAFYLETAFRQVHPWKVRRKLACRGAKVVFSSRGSSARPALARLGFDARVSRASACAGERGDAPASELGQEARQNAGFAGHHGHQGQGHDGDVPRASWVGERVEP